VLLWDAPPEIRECYGRGQLAERIHFLPRQPDSALRDLYCGATALLYPSLYEGFGLPVLEAMSCGCPVVTSNTTSLPEVAGGAAIYVDPRDATSLVAAMESFENGSANAAGLRVKGLDRASMFSWDRAARETLEVYRRCLVS
jgi:glycosyltransferase involved in cell wall biosynthesis